MTETHSRGPEKAVFSKRPLTGEDIAAMRAGDVWNGEGPIGPDRLNYLTLSYIDFDSNLQTGPMMVLDVVADSVLGIFKKLYERNFPIARIALMSDFGGDDEKAMSANASNAFVSRAVAATGEISSHAYGCAIDVNQIQNPYLVFKEGQFKVFPPQSGIGYLNRSESRPGEPPRPGLLEPVVPIFREGGFTVWGGDWNDYRIDYHHFQLPWDLIERLAATDFENGKKLFAAHLQG